MELENVDKEIDKARKELSDAKLADDGSAGAKAAIATEKTKLDAAKAKKDAIRSDTSGGGSIKDFEKATHEAKAKLDVASDKITTAYAEAIGGGLSKTINIISRLGSYSIAGADEAARKIRSGTKLDSGEKPH